jgi:phosphatidylserine synthase
MLQRTQTLFLIAIVIICSVLSLYSFPFFEIQDVTNSEKVLVSYNSTLMISQEASINESNTLIVSCLIAIISISLISIFSYKNRKLQLLLTSFNYLFIFILISLMYNFSIHMDYFKNSGESNFQYGVFVPVVLILQNLFAFRGIKKDEQLIRSMDRLR